MAQALDPWHHDKVAERLKNLRETSGMNQRAFAQHIGVSPTAWNNYETGKRRIEIDQAIKLKLRLGVPLDWIYVGDASSLPLRIVDQMRQTASAALIAH